MSYTSHKCPICFKWVNNLNSHKRTHTKRFTCDICRHSFSQRSVLANHNRRLHSNTGETPAKPYDARSRSTLDSIYTSSVGYGTARAALPLDQFQSAFRFIWQNAWSGNSNLADLALGQHYRCLSMLKDAAIGCDSQPSIHSENLSRLLYDFVMMDLEFAALCNLDPQLPLNELISPLPRQELLWKSGTADQRSRAYGPTPSLHDLFQNFVQSDLERLQSSITEHQLYLLLYALQSLNDMSLHQHVQKWYYLSDTYIEAGHGSLASNSNMVLYYLICLNKITKFSQTVNFEQQAAYRRFSIIQCGQILRLIRSMPKDGRPDWWSSAIYRTTEVIRSAFHTPLGSTTTDVSGKQFAIDILTPKHHAVMDYVNGIYGTPVLTDSEGKAVGLYDSYGVVQYALAVLKEGAACGLSNMIQVRLKEEQKLLGDIWNI